MRTRAVLIPYVIARVVVLVALATSRHIFRSLRIAEPIALRQGLSSRDAAWYGDITRGGYNAVAKEGLRFFPLFPLLGKAVSFTPGVGPRAADLIVANVC